MAATVQLLLPSLRRATKAADHSGLSCEIVSSLCPNPFSHDWHVQPSCQRPKRDPPERRAFSPGEFYLLWACFSAEPTGTNPTVLETLQTYCAARNPVNRNIPQDFHIGNSQIGTQTGELMFVYSAQQ